MYLDSNEATGNDVWTSFNHLNLGHLDLDVQKLLIQRAMHVHFCLFLISTYQLAVSTLLTLHLDSTKWALGLFVISTRPISLFNFVGAGSRLN